MTTKVNVTRLIQHGICNMGAVNALTYCADKQCDDCVLHDEKEPLTRSELLAFIQCHDIKILRDDDE